MNKDTERRMTEILDRMNARGKMLKKLVKENELNKESIKRLQTLEHTYLGRQQ